MKDSFFLIISSTVFFSLSSSSAISTSIWSLDFCRNCRRPASIERTTCTERQTHRSSIRYIHMLADRHVCIHIHIHIHLQTPIPSGLRQKNSLRRNQTSARAWRGSTDVYSHIHVHRDVYRQARTCRGTTARVRAPTVVLRGHVWARNVEADAGDVWYRAGREREREVEISEGTDG